MSQTPTPSQTPGTEEVVVYLDIDGVLRTKRSNHKHVVAELQKTMPNLVHKGTAFDPITIASLNALTDETGAKIVLCTSHRDNARIKKILRDAGVTGEFHKDWRTPSLKDQPVMHTIDTPDDEVFTLRGREIGAHLAANPKIKRWVWVDDAADCLPCQRPHLVQVSEETGFGPREVDSALEILGHKPHENRRQRLDAMLAHAKSVAGLAKQLLPKD